MMKTKIVNNEIETFINDIFQAKNKNDINTIMDAEFHKFIELTKLKSWRKSFVNIFKDRLDSK